MGISPLAWSWLPFAPPRAGEGGEGGHGGREAAPAQRGPVQAAGGRRRRARLSVGKASCALERCDGGASADYCRGERHRGPPPRCGQPLHHLRLRCRLDHLVHRGAGRREATPPVAFALCRKPTRPNGMTAVPGSVNAAVLAHRHGYGAAVRSAPSRAVAFRPRPPLAPRPRQALGWPLREVAVDSMRSSRGRDRLTFALPPDFPLLPRGERARLARAELVTEATRDISPLGRYRTRYTRYMPSRLCSPKKQTMA